MESCESIRISSRSAHFPLRVRSRRLVALLHALARALERHDVSQAARHADAIARTPAIHEVLHSDGSASVSPTLRAKALASVLMDLARGGWAVSLDDGEVYVTAPRWATSAAGTSSAELSAEKARVRSAMAGRVQEEMEIDSVRRFILEMEAPRTTEHGTRSVLSLFADGRALGAALRASGSAALRPYLQPADNAAGRDPHTGLKYTDIFRYFRYLWSFPLSGSPGRSVPFLIRDAGQTGAPVCGLVSVASPVPRLSVRDEAFGWTPAWLEAVVAALEFPLDAPAPHLRAIADAWRVREDRDGSAGALIEDIAALLQLPSTRDVDCLATAILALAAPERCRRRERARRRLMADLRDELRQAIEGISFRGFGFDHAFALERPATAYRRLETRKAGVVEKWKDSRRIKGRGGPPNARPKNVASSGETALRTASSQPLFVKKRVSQAAKLLRGWEDLCAAPGERSSDALRRWTLGPCHDAAVPVLTGGSHVSRGIRAALLQRQNRLIASQVLDVSVCGAVPPYGPLLCGKLAALAALSSDVAAAYHARYARRASEISSQMAGQEVKRSADVIALTTTSFFSAGSSQYERLSLPTPTGSVRWRYVGRSRGNGSLHFSKRTAELLDQLLCVETGRRLITSRFGEGPSEKMRKIRDGLELLGLDSGEFLEHGMPRLVYIAELAPQCARPAAPNRARAWRRVGPSMEEVAGFWAERWLGSRLKSKPEVIDEVEAFEREGALLGRRLDPATTEMESRP
jgi:hypothetical protein